MTQLTTTPEGFRTAAYLAARARLDIARSRSGKTSRSVDCNPPNVRCGGRCIPPAWDCRLKGEGPDPHLRAVKTDPLSGFANIQRGIGRITKGVTRGNLSEVQGGRAAIIRGVVKTVPGDIQQKKQLKTTLENRTRAIGLGLAVVTTGLGMHAILMKGNVRYREGVGSRINTSVRLGVNKVLDATPIVGANRARVATRAASGINAELTRQRNPVSAELTNQLAKTKVSAADEAGQSNLVRSLEKVNKDPAFRAGDNATFNAWDRAHQNAFWSTKRVDKSYGESSIFARPATDEFLARQFNLQGDDVLTSAAVKDAVERNLTTYKTDLIDLAQQQGFKVNKTSGGGRAIDKEVRREFIQAQVRATLPIGQSNTRVRAALTKHLEKTLIESPSTRANGIYKETFDGFNEFYTAKAGIIESATAEPRLSSAMRATGAGETLFSARQARASFVARRDVKGPSHAELVLRQHYAQSVSGTPRSMFTVTDRLASAAASEIEGRNVGPAEAFRVLEREGVSGAVPQRTTAAPRSSAGLASQASLSARARSIMARAGNENMSTEAALRQARAELADRGDSADLPPRVAAYLQAQHRADAAGEKGLGKPCGASHIPKTYECSKGAAGSSSAGNKKAAIIAAVVGGAVAIGVAGAVAYNVKTISDPSKTPLAPSPNIRDVVKAAKAEAGTKSASEAMGHYYVNKSGLKPGDVVYFRTAKDPSAHFGVYLGPGKDGVVRAVIANTKASRFSWADVMEIGATKPGVKTAQATLPPLVKAPTPQFLQGGKGPYTSEEVVRRAIRISSTDYKFSVTRNNCETLANTIAYGVPKSEQLDRLNRATKAMIDVTVGRGQRRKGERAIYEGKAQGRNYTAADFSKFLEGERAFSSPQGKDLARQYDTYFKGYNLDAQNAPNYLGLISPSELWSSINTYEAPVRAQAMSNYLFAARTLKEMTQR